MNRFLSLLVVLSFANFAFSAPGGFGGGNHGGGWGHGPGHGGNDHGGGNHGGGWGHGGGFPFPIPIPIPVPVPHYDPCQGNFVGSFYPDRSSARLYINHYAGNSVSVSANIRGYTYSGQGSCYSNGYDQANLTIYLNGASSLNAHVSGNVMTGTEAYSGRSFTLYRQ